MWTLLGVIKQQSKHSAVKLHKLIYLCQQIFFQNVIFLQLQKQPNDVSSTKPLPENVDTLTIIHDSIRHNNNSQWSSQHTTLTSNWFDIFFWLKNSMNIILWIFPILQNISIPPHKSLWYISQCPPVELSKQILMNFIFYFKNIILVSYNYSAVAEAEKGFEIRRSTEKWLTR